MGFNVHIGTPHRLPGEGCRAPALLLPCARPSPDVEPVLARRNRGGKTRNKMLREQRKRELQKITRENQAILRRIQAAEPTYDHLAWAEHERTHEEYMKNICELPIRTKVGMTATMSGAKSGGAL